MSINKDQARMLTALAVACRPVGAPRWDDEGTFRAIGKIQSWSLPIVIEHVIRHAADPKAKTPGVIGSSHTPAELGMPTPGPMRRGENCTKHIGERAESCSWCVHGIKAWDEIDPEPTTPTTTGPDGVRAALREARGVVSEESK